MGDIYCPRNTAGEEGLWKVVHLCQVENQAPNIHCGRGTLRWVGSAVGMGMQYDSHANILEFSKWSFEFTHFLRSLHNQSMSTA